MIWTNDQMCALPDEIKMPLYLGMVDRTVKVVIVTKSSNVSIFDKLFPNENCSDIKYIHNSQVLDKHRTLQFHKINPQDLIIAVRNPTEHQKFMDRQKEVCSMLDHEVYMSKEKYQNRVNFISNSAIRNESLRLRDLQFAKAELRPKLIKIERRTNNIENKPKMPTNIPAKAKLSTTPLPRFW